MPHTSQSAQFLSTFSKSLWLDILAVMILKPGEKIHVIHRRNYDKDQHRHFIGVVDAYEGGIARVSGHTYTVDTTTFKFLRRPELRTRIIALASDVLINIIPTSVDLEKITYRQEKKAVRVTDGSDWHLDLSEFTWK
ncbi:MAG: hypothetical protein SFY81_09620 [Verrucomicrobiota bacterium]|nr:hypothetical protein [Verrucomicrobiota bacterium]